MFGYLLATFLIITAEAESLRLTKDVPINSIYPNGRIFGGTPTDIKNYPHQVSLQYSGSHICGGSIISENYVLTAGHCVTGSSISRLSIRSGSSYREKGGKVHQISKIISHEKFSTNRYGIPFNDLALIKVAQPFKFDSTRKAIELFNLNEESFAGEMATVSGWGSTEDNYSPVQLRKVDVPIVEKSLCNKAYQQFGGLPKGQICAAYYGEGGKDHCYGDSGGPLIVNGKLAGIVSWGHGCAEAYYPGVYTEVAYFRDWINKNVDN